MHLLVRLARWYTRRAALLAIILWAYVVIAATFAAGWWLHWVTHR